jgi:hypothetical protein
MSDQVLTATVADLPAAKPASKPNHSSSVTPQTRLAILAGMVLVGIAYLVASVFPGNVPYLRSAGTTDTSANAVAMHCERFIEIARAHYGSNWKYRLDPSDGLCATQVQLEWERQWGVPGAPGSEPAAPIKSVSDEITPPEAAPVVEAVPAASKPETSCLNIIWLAKAKHGAEWRSNIDAGLQAQCAGEISRMVD